MQLSQAKKKWVRSLGLKKNRDEEKLFISEGAKVISDIIRGGNIPQFVVKQNNVPLPSELSAGFEIFECDETDMKVISQLATAPGILAVFNQWHFDETVLEKQLPRWLIADGIKDPGNMGTLIRTAHWFGVDAVIAMNSCAELYNSKTIQSTMGSLGKVPIFYVNAESFFVKHKSQTTFYGADLEGDVLNTIEPQSSFALVIGSESHGLSDVAKKHITQKIYIPEYDIANRPESLNAAVSAGIILSRIAG